MELLNFLIYLLIIMGIYGILSMSLNFHYGFSGLINFGHVAFFSMGAYASALLALHGVPFPLALLGGAVAAGFLGYLISIPTSNLPVTYWAIITLAAAEIVRLVALNEEWLTRGSFGLINIPKPLGHVIPTDRYPAFYLGIVLTAVIVTYVILRQITRSPFGRVLLSLREEDELPLSLGKNVFAFKVQAMIIGAAFAGVSGSLYAHYITYISSEDFMPILTFIAWAMVIVGGKGNHLGALLGAVVIQTFYSSTRFVDDYIPISSQRVGSIRMIIIGVLIILVLLYMNQGLLPEKKRLYRVPGEGGHA